MTQDDKQEKIEQEQVDTEKRCCGTCIRANQRLVTNGRIWCPFKKSWRSVKQFCKCHTTQEQLDNKKE